MCKCEKNGGFSCNSCPCESEGNNMPTTPAKTCDNCHYTCKTQLGVTACSSWVQATTRRPKITSTYRILIYKPNITEEYTDITEADIIMWQPILQFISDKGQIIVTNFPFSAKTVD